MGLETLHGVGTALVTPRLSATSLNYDVFEKLLERQYDTTQFTVVLGTTGETEFLSQNQRIELVERTLNYYRADEFGRNKPVIVGASAGNTHEAILRAQLALQLGADALLITPPPYVKPRQDGIVNHYTAISKEVGNAPIVVYNVPSRVGANILPETLDQIASHCNVIAVKEASGDLKQLKSYVDVSCGKFVVLSGDDATTYEAMKLGAKGVISVVSNLVPEEMSTMISTFLAGDLVRAQEIDTTLRLLYEGSMKYGNPVSIKAMMELCGHKVGEAHSSLGTLNDDERGILRKIIETPRF